jgi:hypothetical protein
MAIVGGYGTGTSASAVWYSTVDELLGQLPDNDASLIRAADIRDSVYSLYAYIQGVSSVAASASVSAGGQLYSNSNSVPFTVGGVTAGTTFVGTFSLQQMFDRLLYPYVPPSAHLNDIAVREFGSPLSVSLGWSASVRTNPISFITVNGTPKIFPPYSGVEVATGTYSLPLNSIEQSNSFLMSVIDNSAVTSTSSTTLTWRHRVYWGVYNFGQFNLTTNPGSASYMASLISDSDVRTMLSGNANGSAVNSSLAVDKSRTLLNMNGGGSHLVFAWPSLFSNSTTPTFTVNNVPNNAFTNLKTNYLFTNQYGLTASYEIWVSNTLQNSPLNIIIS